MRKLSFILLVSVVAACAYADSETITSNMMKIDNITTFCTGGLVVVESAMLLFGMNYPAVSSWSTPKNLIFAISDVVLGGTLIYYSLSGRPFGNNWLYYTVMAALVLGHIYREIEFVGKFDEPFLNNTPLFILNNVRIGLLAASAGLTISLAIQ